MFIGHFALAFAAKSTVPRVSLGTLFLAVQLPDLLWPTLLVLGVETVRIVPGITTVTPLEFVSYPVSHSLATSLAWAGVFAGVHFAIRRAWVAALVLGGGVASHWLLDFVTHRPDLPLHPGSGLRVGLELWRSLPGTLAVEGALFAGGVWWYARTTSPVDRAGSVGLAMLVALLAALYLGNLFGPPPPGERALAWAGHATWLLVLAGYWLDRHRRPRSPAGGMAAP